jgi:hypothetical protein
MKGSVLFTYPKAVTVHHYPDAKACVARWEALSAPCFREAVARGLTECGRLGGKSWIVDLTGPDPGVPTQADLAWISGEGMDVARDAGILAVINVHGKSAVASMGAKRWSKMLTDGGISTYDCASVSDALQLATEIAAEKSEQE